MSDRDDIDVVNSDKKAEEISSDESNEIYSTKQKINHAIRQNPLTHLGEKSEKPTLLERLKRAFSTEDTYGGGFIADDVPDDGGLIEDPVDLFGNIFSRLKRDAVNEADNGEQSEEYPEKESVQSSETQEKTDEHTEDGIATEEEELAIINSVLDGVPVDEAIKQTEKKNNETHTEFDEEGEFTFIPDSEEEDSEAEAADISSEEASDREDDDEDEEFCIDEDYFFDESDDEPDDDRPIDINAEIEKIEEPTAEEESEVEETEEPTAEEESEVEETEEPTAEEESEVEETEEPTAEEESEVEETEEPTAEEESEVEETEEPTAEEESESEETEEPTAEEESEVEETEEPTAEEETEVEETEEATAEEESEVEETEEPTAEEESEVEETEEPTAEEESEVEKTEEPTAEEETEVEKTEEPTADEETEVEETEEPTAEEETEVEKTEEPTADEETEVEETEEPTEEELDVDGENTVKNGRKLSEIKDAAAKNVGSAVSRLKGICSKTKNKLVELWNTKDDGTVEVSQNQAAEQVGDEPAETMPDKTVAESAAENVEAAEKIGNIEQTEKDDKSENTEQSRKTGSDSEENQEDITEGNEALYAGLFDGESELDKFKKEIYGEDYEQLEESSEDRDAESDADDAESNCDEDAEDNNERVGIAMTVIKNDVTTSTGIDTQKLRESLNVIDGEKSSDREEDIGESAEVDEHQLRMNRNVLDKVKKYEEETADQKEEIRRASAERTARAYEREFGASDPITEIEITDYITPNSADEIKVKAGRFSESVKSEYEFYVGYTRLKNVAKSQSRIAEQKPGVRGTESDKRNEQRFSEFSNDKFAKSHDRLDSVTRRLDFKDTKTPNALEYRSEDDAEKVKRKLQSEYKHSKTRWTLSLVITVITFILFCSSGKFTAGAGEAAGSGSERVFAILNFILYGGAVYVCRDIIINGLRPLRKIKTNCDTGVALATAVVGLQSLIAVFAPSSFFRQGLNVYSLIVMLVLAMYSLGGFLNAKRAAANFRFVADSSQKYTGKFFHDQRMVATLLSGTRNEKSELVFQKKTSFLKHFVKLSKSPDPGEDISSKFALPTLVFAVVISIIYFVLSKSFIDSVSVLSIMLCMAVPMCGKALGAVPLHKLSKDSLANQAMVVGYPAVEHFSESAAIMLDAKELYPEGSVHLNGIKTFDQRRVDDAMLAAASVIISAGGAMAGMFDGIIFGDKQEALPAAESVMYEDGRGIIGWVNNDRIFVGNRQLLIAHGIEPMPVEYEEEQRSGGDEILYLACAGELVAMFIVGYSANRRVADVLRRMEANGMSLLIRTTDVNITAERISKDFGIYHRSIKILEQKSSNVIRDEMIGKEKSSPAFVATKGGVTSFGRAVSGCIKAKKDISLSLALQIVGVLLGLLIVTTIVLFAGVQHIGSIQMFIFALLWNVIVLIAPAVLQRFQKY